MSGNADIREATVSVKTRAFMILLISNLGQTIHTTEMQTKQKTHSEPQQKKCTVVLLQQSRKNQKSLSHRAHKLHMQHGSH